MCATGVRSALLVGKVPLIVRVDCPEVAPDAMVAGLNEQVIPAGAEGAADSAVVAGVVAAAELFAAAAVTSMYVLR